uniref:Uncharacterized protein n=1 Tax=Panagrolaimus davidi TaxID=227884 RepID=A0A914PKW1_9BILA
MIGANFDLWQPNNIITSLAYSTTGFLSICHMIVNFMNHSEYRKQIERFAKHFIGIHSSTVQTIARRSRKISGYNQH